MAQAGVWNPGGWWLSSSFTIQPSTEIIHHHHPWVGVTPLSGDRLPVCSLGVASWTSFGIPTAEGVHHSDQLFFFFFFRSAFDDGGILTYPTVNKKLHNASLGIASSLVGDADAKTDGFCTLS